MNLHGRFDDRTGSNLSQNSGNGLLDASLQFASAQARNAFAEDLSNSLAELIARHHVEEKGGRRFRLFLGMYPALKKEERREQDSQD